MSGAVREAAASYCESLADLMANGAGGTAEERLRQAARMIRSKYTVDSVGDTKGDKT